MCGISGFNFSSEELIRKMNAKVKHRGPDGDGIFVCGDASLGHTRLSIIDLSEKASQPMFSQDESLVLVFNGEIYNFQEIRDELRKKGHQFRSNSDSEVIISAYQEYGAECLQKFNGIFAFAIYDKKDNSLFVARDRVGIKPLYYYWDPSASSGRAKLVFSSEIKAILEHNVPFVYADAIMFKGMGLEDVYKMDPDKLSRTGWPKRINSNNIYNIHAQTVLVSKDVYKTYGLYDEDLKCKVDREMWLRLFGKENKDKPKILNFYIFPLSLLPFYCYALTHNDKVAGFAIILQQIFYL